jgi:putative ABC transport system permease protein
VVRDIPLRRFETASEPVLYTSYLQQPARYQGPLANMFGQMTFLVRTSGNPMSLAPAARQAVSEVSDVPIADLVTMEQQADGDLPNRRYYMLVFGTFSAIATVLAAIGIFGVLEYAVAQRLREIGIRMALGASTHRLVLLVGGKALVMIAAGLAIGLPAAVGLSRLIASQLWGITPTDPATFATVCVLFVFVAACACLSPLRRALKVDPAATLRTE